MANNRFNPTLLEEGIGAIGVVVTVLGSPVLRPFYSKWGATKSEIDGSLPGDEIVPDPNMLSTRAITIEAPVNAVWPWLVQMGQGRGGLYSYERLENLVGCDMHNADRIIPEFQQLTVGDEVRLSKGDEGPFFIVSAVLPNQAVVLSNDKPPSTWAFVLQPLNENRTRLLIRYRQDFPPSLGNVVMWRGLVDPIHFVMERKMLQGIKLRAEAVGQVQPTFG